ncbi:MAG: Lsr2 family protein [Microbacterium enclense]
MAKKHITQLIDDLDGSVLEDGATINFSIEGRAYEIDLSQKNVKKLREAIEPFAAAARPVGSLSSGRRASRGRSTSTRDLADVRSWAEKNGHAINSRGRISTNVLAAYDAAH